MGWKIKIDPADKYFSIYVRLRDRQCQRCGSPVKFNEKGLPVSHQNSHFIGRRKEATRFSLLNATCLCGGCHSFFTENPLDHHQWQINRHGKRVIDALIVAGNSYQKKQRELEKQYWRAKIKSDFGITV